MTKDLQSPFSDAVTICLGEMLTTGAPFSIVRLGAAHIGPIHALHKQSIAALGNDEKSFLLEKPKSFFETHFKNAHDNAVIGILCNGELVGQSIILNPNDTHPQTGMTDMPSIGTPNSITVLQGVSVLPAYRNNKLMHQMVHAWLNQAVLDGKHHALAEVEVHNIGSWSSFLNEGLHITGIGTDPDDGAMLYNLHETVPNIMKKRLSAAFNHAAADSINCPIHDFDTQKKMLSDGYAISGWKKELREFILTPKA